MNTKFNHVIGHREEIYKISTFIDMNLNKEKYIEAGISVPKCLVLYGDENNCKSFIVNEAVKFVKENASNINVFSDHIKDDDFQNNDEFFIYIKDHSPFDIAIIAMTECQNTLVNIYNLDKKDYMVVSSRSILDPDRVKFYTRMITNAIPDIDDRTAKLYGNIFTSIKDHNSVNDILQNAKIIHIRDSIHIRHALMKAYCEHYARYKFNEKLDDRAYSVAIHEASHVVVGLYNGINTSFVTIAKSALDGGCTYFKDLLHQDKYDKVIKTIDITLGGLVGEEVILNQISTTSSGDIEDIIDHCKKLARSGSLFIPDSDEFSITERFRNLDYEDNDENVFTPDQDTRDTIAYLISERYKIVGSILVKNKHIVEAIAKALINSDNFALDEIDIEYIVNDCGGIVYD